MIKSVKIKANAKVNIGLNICGMNEKYHSLDTVMAEINLYDTISLTTRKDKNVNLTVKGCKFDEVSIADNNVYKTAIKFIERFGVNGADITLTKNIPIGSGLGGSSADIVGTVKAFCKAYDVTEDVLPFIKELCSDGEFLFNGGFARVKGRGEVVEKFTISAPLYMVIIVPEKPSVTANVFSEFDNGEYPDAECNVDEIITRLKNNESFDNKKIFNALELPAKKFNDEITLALDEISKLSPKIYFMSGSGCSVIGVFESVELCAWAKSKLSKKFEQIFIKETVKSRI